MRGENALLTKQLVYYSENMHTIIFPGQVVVIEENSLFNNFDVHRTVFGASVKRIPSILQRNIEKQNSRGTKPWEFSNLLVSVK